MTPPFEILHRREVYNGLVFTIIRDEVRHRDGYETVREVVQHGGGAVIVPVLPGPDILLIRQFRYPLQEEILELPAGKLDRGEDPMECAKRELREETGYIAACLTHLSSMWTTPGFCSEVLHLYMATDLTAGMQALEQGEESISVMRTSLYSAIEMCREGKIRDGKSITGLMLAALRLGLLSLNKGNTT